MDFGNVQIVWYSFYIFSFCLIGTNFKIVCVHEDREIITQFTCGVLRTTEELYIKKKNYDLVKANDT